MHTVLCGVQYYSTVLQWYTTVVHVGCIPYGTYPRWVYYSIRCGTVLYYSTGTHQYMYPWVGALYYSTTWVGMHTYIHGCVPLQYCTTVVYYSSTTRVHTVYCCTTPHHGYSTIWYPPQYRYRYTPVYTWVYPGIHG